MHKQTETENKRNKGREEVQSDLLHELPDWLQKFRENLVDERNPVEPRGNPEPGGRDFSMSSPQLPLESRAKLERVRVSTVYRRTFRKTQIAISA